MYFVIYFNRNPVNVYFIYALFIFVEVSGIHDIILYLIYILFILLVHCPLLFKNVP